VNWSRREFFLSAAALLQGPTKGVVVILLGPPGAGKTTQAQFLSNKYKIPIFSAATLLKKSHDRKSDFSKKVKGKISPEELLTDQGMNDLVREAVIKADHERGFVLDGYPSSPGQAQYLTGLLQELGLSAPLVVHLAVSDELAKQRLSTRGSAADKPEIIDRRLAYYRKEESVVLNYYSQSVIRIDGSQSVGDVTKQIETALAKQGR
jgi:adenylate kinase